MNQQTATTANAMHLLDLPGGLVTHQGLAVAARLGVADLLKDGPDTTTNLACQLDVNESALYRLLRVLASQGVFEETEPRTFVNTSLSHFLRTGVTGSVRALVSFRGSEFYFAPFGELLHTIQTGKPAASKIDGTSGFESLRQDPEQARLFDDAMTNMSELVAPAIASAYDFGQWDSLTDVGGGSGVLLSAILKAYPHLQGVLADQPHVLERAKDRSFLSGELAARARMQPCDFLSEIPIGSRAYLLKNIMANWDDEQAHKILCNCRHATPADGALILVDFSIPEGNTASRGKLVDLTTLVLYGGKVRSIAEYENLLNESSFRLNQLIPVPGELSIIEALPV